MDDKNKITHGGGHGQVEFCDIFTINKELIHIKKYGKSSIFSHLFSQGLISGQLLQLDSEFRKKVKDKLSGNFKDLINIDTRPNPNEYTIIFGIISDSKEIKVKIPFFSRVNINNTKKILVGFGFEVELLKISVSQDHSRTIIYKPQKIPRKRLM